MPIAEGEGIALTITHGISVAIGSVVPLIFSLDLDRSLSQAHRQFQLIPSERFLLLVHLEGVLLGGQIPEILEIIEGASKSDDEGANGRIGSQHFGWW